MRFNEKLFKKNAETYKETTWVNNTKYTAEFMLMTNELEDGRNPHVGSCRPVRLAPGESIKLRSLYDHAIRSIDPNTGKVCGGLCPWLDTVEDEQPEMESSLDFEAAIQMARIKEMQDKIAKQTAMKLAMSQRDKIEEELKSAVAALDEIDAQPAPVKRRGRKDQ